eukprot:8611969-Alexandrium_andersonii.AAC.1
MHVAVADWNNLKSIIDKDTNWAWARQGDLQSKALEAASDLEKFHARGFWRDWMLADDFKKSASKSYDAKAIVDNLRKVSDLEEAITRLQKEVTRLKAMQAAREA